MNTDDGKREQDREDGLRELMQRGYAGAPEVDLEKGAWREGRRRRNRRLVQGGVGGAGLVAAVAASAFALSGVLQPQAAETPLQAEQPTVAPTEEPGSTQDDQAPTREPGQTQEPDPTTEPPAATGTPIGFGHALSAPEGWLVVPVWDGAVAGTSTIVSCVVEPGQPGYLDGDECPELGVRIQVDLDQQPLEPFWGPDTCYADPEWVEAGPAVVSVSEEVASGEAVIGGQLATWRRWTATCEDGRTFEPVQYWLAEAGMLASTVLGADDLPSVLDGLALDAGAAQLRGELLGSAELGATSVAGEVNEWPGDGGPIVGTGSQVAYTVTEDTVCLVEDAEREAPFGMYLLPGSCDELRERVEAALLEYSTPGLFAVMVDETGAVVTISRQYTP